jgi:hypothetical protein
MLWVGIALGWAAVEVGILNRTPPEYGVIVYLASLLAFLGLLKLFTGYTEFRERRRTGTVGRI